MTYSLRGMQIIFNAMNARENIDTESVMYAKVYIYIYIFYVCVNVSCMSYAYSKIYDTLPMIIFYRILKE